MSSRLPLPVGQDAASLRLWGTQLVDQLRRETDALSQTAASDNAEIARLEALINDINAQLADLIRLLDGIDGATLTSALAFAAETRRLLDEIQAQTQESIEAALRTARITALSAIRNGLLGTGNQALIRFEQQTRIQENYAFAQQISVMLARIDDAEAAIVEERTVRADGDESFAQYITSLLARVSVTESAIDEERTVRSTLTTALAQKVDTVSTAIGGLSTSVTTISQSLDGISAQWGVSITQQGYIKGLVNLSLDNETTQFTVVADRFSFSNPNAAGGYTQVFDSYTVDNKTYWGLKGDVILDGSIRATAVDADTLDAFTANLGTITAGVMRSPDGKFVIDLNSKSITIDT